MEVAHQFDGGDLDCGSGLILLIRQHMERVPTGGVLEIRSSEPTVAGELPPWCRMTGHTHLLTTEDGPNRWRHFVRRGGDAAAQSEALRSDLAAAQRFQWRVRAKSVGGRQAVVFARSLSWSVGQPASLEERDEHPSALEGLLGSLAAELVNGFATACLQASLGIDEMEATAKAQLHNVSAMLGVEPGDAAISSVEVTLFVTSPASGEALRRVFAEVQSRAPIFCTLKKAAAVQARLAIL
ncbi:MAG: sulfurtransferase TusA family protein [Verrucomicrobiales bacterium]|nr:sulfurtransferase TusA family protein [Verrucomicrobiales bacterium]